MHKYYIQAYKPTAHPEPRRWGSITSTSMLHTQGAPACLSSPQTVPREEDTVCFLCCGEQVSFRSAKHSTAQQALKAQTTGSKQTLNEVLNEHWGKEHEGNSLPCSKVCRILRGHSFNVHVLHTFFPVCHSPCLWKIWQKILGTYLANYFSLLLQVPLLMH